MTSGIGIASFSPRTVTMRIGHIFLHLDFLLHACSDLFESQLYLHPQIGPPVHSPGRPATASKAEASETAENIPEMSKDVIHTHSTAKTSGTAAHTGMSELIVTAPLLLIA